jgi:hypothetical protein
MRPATKAEVLDFFENLLEMSVNEIILIESIHFGF